MNYYEFCIKTVKEAGELLLEKYQGDFTFKNKDGNALDWVSDVDTAVNNFLIPTIQEAYPDHGIHSEEGGGNDKEGFVWALDPIDGTSLFIRRIPHFSICISLNKDNVPIVGAIYNPITKELFSFEKGVGAFLNDTKVTISDIRDLNDSWVHVRAGKGEKLWDKGAKMYRYLLEHANKAYNFGSSSLDLCFVGAGRLDAAVYLRITPQDISAAVGFVREAGGLVVDAEGKELQTNSDKQTVITANSQEILDQILEGLKHSS